MAFKQVASKESKIATVEPIRDKQDIQNIEDWFMSKGWEKYAIIFKFGVMSGLRISDILAFKVKEVYHQSRVIIREQKTGKIKEFPLQPCLQNMLNEFCEGRDGEEWLFEGRMHKKLERSQVYRRIKDACEALKIQANVGTHTLRKTFGYHFYKQFNRVVPLQEIFNHETPGVTLRYIGVTQDEMNDYYLRFNLDPKADELTEIPITQSRARATRVQAFCLAYIRGGCTKHLEFAQMILEMIRAPLTKLK